MLEVSSLVTVVFHMAEERRTSMFVGRQEELEYLKELYEKDGSRTLILYGQSGIGKTALLERFMEGKEAFYYEAVSCSTRQQCGFLAGRLKDKGCLITEYPKFAEIFSAIEELQGKKKLIVLDEFQNICKTDDEFLEEVYAYFYGDTKKEDVLLILCSSSICWVENSLKSKLGKLSDVIEEFYKVKELNYREFREYFSDFSLADSIEAYSILGGIPGLWHYFNGQISLRRNIEQFILHNDGKLHDYGQQYVSEELRETAVYNTILTVLATGKCKLNDLYQATGFSRAKISVYLKHLMQLEVVEKVISVDTEGRENAGKGMYRICNSYVHFYYRYLFPNQNKIRVGEIEILYDELIAPTLKEFAKVGFRQFCIEFLECENRLNRLPEKFFYRGQWIGKKGAIDFIFKDEDEEILAGICNWEKELLTYEDYQIFMECQESAKIKAEYMILFAAGKFDNRLREEAKKNPYLALVSLEQMQFVK